MLGLVEAISTETVRQALKNDIQPWIVQTWCVPPRADAACVWRVEDVIQTSRLPDDPAYPVLCFDEACQQLFGDVRSSQPPGPGMPARLDYAYERKGVCHQRMMCEPLRGWRHVQVTERRTRRDYAACVRELGDVHDPRAKKIRLVQDNLNTHDGASLYETFSPAEARRMLNKIEFYIRAAYDGNLSDYFDTIPHAFYHNVFLVVSNGDRARYSSITSGWEHFGEWKRNDEHDKGSLEARVLLDGMLAKERLLDLVGHFILFDSSQPGRTCKVVARNPQVLGVNNAVASVLRQEALKKAFPPEERLRTYELPRGNESLSAEDKDAYHGSLRSLARAKEPIVDLPLVQRAHRSPAGGNQRRVSFR